MSARTLPFDRLVRRCIRRDDTGPHIDTTALARELQRYDADVRERLRLAALRAIEAELAIIRAERKDNPPC